jgi:hypothetical protein
MPAIFRIEDRPRHLRVRTELQDGAQVCISVPDAGVIHDPRHKQSPFEASHTTESAGMTSVVSVSSSIAIAAAFGQPQTMVRSDVVIFHSGGSIGYD